MKSVSVTGVLIVALLIIAAPAFSTLNMVGAVSARSR